jgi:hypothetical protein
MARPVSAVLVCGAIVLMTTHTAHGERATSATQTPGKTPPKIVFSNPPASEMVQIDGAKNPELIPQWHTWGFAFRVIAGGPKAIPSVVLIHLTKDEADLLHREAEADQKNDEECQRRVMRLVPLLSTPEATTVNEKTREINLDCRWQTLRARDRVLQGMAAEGQAALTSWVESNKTGMQVSVPKAELDFFRQPQ